MSTLEFAPLLIVTWSLFIGTGDSVSSGMKDMSEHCNYTKLLCNDSRLLKDDKTIILNIANGLRNRVAEGSFRYHNISHDPIVNMNKLYWNETLASKAAEIVSKCPKVTPSFIKEQTSIVPDQDGIDQIRIVSSIDPKKYIPGNEVAGCEVSNIYYEEKLTQCSPQKIKERIIRLLSDGGLGSEGRKYDIRDFWIVNRYGEPKLTFRRHEAHSIGCSFMIRTSKTHYHTFLTCIHCPYNSSLPILGHPGENCPKHLPNLDEKYESLCSDRRSEYRDINQDSFTVECESGRRSTSSHSHSEFTDKGDVTRVVTMTDSNGKVVTDSSGRVATKPRMHTATDSSRTGATQPGGLPVDTDKMETGIDGSPVHTIETSTCKTTYVQRDGLPEEKFPNTSKSSVKPTTESRIPETRAPSSLSSSPSKVTQMQTNRAGTTILTKMTTRRQLDTTKTTIPKAKKPQSSATTAPNTSRLLKTTIHISTPSSTVSTVAKLSTTDVSRPLDTTRTTMPRAKEPQSFTTIVADTSKFPKTTSQTPISSSIASTAAKLSTTEAKTRTSSPVKMSSHPTSSKITMESLSTSAESKSVFSKVPTSTLSRTEKIPSSEITKSAVSTETPMKKLFTTNATSTSLNTSPGLVSSCKTVVADTAFNHSTHAPHSSKTASIHSRESGLTVQTSTPLTQVQESTTGPDISAHTTRKATITTSSSIAAPSSTLPTTKKAMVTSSISITPSTSWKSTMLTTGKSASTKLQATARSQPTRIRTKVAKFPHSTDQRTMSTFKINSTMTSIPSLTPAASQVPSVLSSLTTKKITHLTASQTKFKTSPKQEQSKFDLFPSPTSSNTMSATFTDRLESSTCKTIIVPRSSPTSPKKKPFTDTSITDALESKGSEIKQPNVTYGTSFTTLNSSPLSILDSIKSGSTEGKVPSTQTTCKTTRPTEMIDSTLSSTCKTVRPSNDSGVITTDCKNTDITTESTTEVRSSPCDPKGTHPLCQHTQKTTSRDKILTHSPSTEASTPSTTTCKTTTRKSESANPTSFTTTCKTTLGGEKLAPTGISTLSPSTEASAPSTTTCKTTTHKSEPSTTTPCTTTCKTTVANKSQSEDLPRRISTLCSSTGASTPSTTTCKTTTHKSEPSTTTPCTTTCKTTVVNLPSTTTCKTTTHKSEPSSTTPCTTTCKTTVANNSHSEDLPRRISTLCSSTGASTPSTTTCKTTTHKSEPSTTTPCTTTCKTTVVNLPSTTTCKTTTHKSEPSTTTPCTTTCKTTVVNLPSTTTCKTTTHKSEPSTTTPCTTTCKTTLANKSRSEDLPRRISTLSSSTEASTPSTTTCKTTTRKSESSPTAPFTTTCRTTTHATKARGEESATDAMCTTCKTETVTRVNHLSNQSEKPISMTKLYQEGGSSKERPTSITSKSSIPSTVSKSAQITLSKNTEVKTISTTNAALSIAEANIISTFTTCKSTTKLTQTPPPESTTGTTCKTTTKQDKAPLPQSTTGTTCKTTTKQETTPPPPSATSTTCKTTTKQETTTPPQSTTGTTCKTTTKLGETSISTCKTATSINSTKAASDTPTSTVTTLIASKVPSRTDTRTISTRGKSTFATKISSPKSNLTSHHLTTGTRSPNSATKANSLINAVGQSSISTKLPTQAQAGAHLTTKTPISLGPSSGSVTTCRTTTKIPPSTTSDNTETTFQTDLVSTRCRTTTPRVSATPTLKISTKIDSTVGSTTCKTTVSFIPGANTRARGDILTLTQGTLFNASFYTTHPSPKGNDQLPRDNKTTPSDAPRPSIVHGSGLNFTIKMHSIKPPFQFPRINISDCKDSNRTGSINTVNVTRPTCGKNDTGQVFTHTTGGYFKGGADHQNSSAYPPIFKHKPCLCINWYLICLIFTIAFIFAWCLLCWQKMLL